MRNLISQLPWSIVIVLTVAIGLAPFAPEPHLLQKLQMLSQGKLRQVVDIFDLLFHASPLAVLILKLFFRYF